MWLFFSLFFVCFLQSQEEPKISIITSVYDGDEFIVGFMQDIVRQTCFDECELIIINANSPGNEEIIIKQYVKQYQNIRYTKLDYDPGLYAVWNIAIQCARGIYITNANIDDRLKKDCYAVHAAALDKYSEVDLVYSDFYITRNANQTFECNFHTHVGNMPEFSQKQMRRSLPNNHPMWRKSLHEKYGFFDATYKYVGDWEMWLRAVKRGAFFLKIPGIYSLYYYNPRGLSTNRKSNSKIIQEEQDIFNQYKSLFQ